MRNNSAEVEGRGCIPSFLPEQERPQCASSTVGTPSLPGPSLGKHFELLAVHTHRRPHALRAVPHPGAPPWRRACSVLTLFWSLEDGRPGPAPSLISPPQGSSGHPAAELGSSAVHRPPLRAPLWNVPFGTSQPFTLLGLSPSALLPHDPVLPIAPGFLPDLLKEISLLCTS